MKIKLAILDKDPVYLNRMVSVFSMKYAENLEIYLFTDAEVALSSLESSRIEVLLASEVFELDRKRIPRRCSFAYFVESPDVETIYGERAVCKFQKADLIYKQILSLYSENARNISGLHFGNEDCRMVAFTSPSGGVGNSTAAAASALYFTLQGHKTLYLDLERFGSTDSFFSGEGQYDMSDIIFALKNKKANLAIKLESSVRRTQEGVYFYSQPKIALDMMELDMADVTLLLNELRLSGTYEYIILDLDFGMDKESMEILHQMEAIVWVSNGSAIANQKTSQAYQSLAVMESSADLPLTKKIFLLYNNFRTNGSGMIQGVEMNNLGGIPRIAQATDADIVRNIASMNVFHKLSV